MITVLVNPTAGGSTTPDLANDIVAAFAAAGAVARVVTLKPGDDVAALARDAARTSAVVVAAGGDGTVSAVAGALIGSPAALGVLAVGTLNHFARDLKLPIGLEAGVATIVAGRACSVDVAEVNGRAFVNNSSIGVYPNAVAIREQLRRSGHRKWTAMAIATWRVLRRYRGIHVRLTVNGRQFTARTPFVFVGNNEYVIEGVQVGARQQLTSGTLFVYLAPKIATRRLPMLVLRSLFGLAPRTGGFEVIPTTDVTIEVIRSGHLTVSMDGETAPLAPPLRYQARPGALRVIA